MIIEIPTASELSEAGLNLLNLAWTTGVRLLSDLKSQGLLDWLEELELTGAYWQRSQPSLANGLAVIDQALETLLKARIAAVSPYLLLERRFSESHANSDTRFADLRTVGGGELLGLHNTVAPTRLPPDFGEFLRDIRRERNVIMHQPSSSDPVTVGELFTHVVKAYRFLFPNERWLDVRLKHLESHPLTFSWDGPIYKALHGEMELLTETLSAEELEACFEYKKSYERYICLKCDGRFAQLSPDEATGTRLFCCVCGEER